MNRGFLLRFLVCRHNGDVHQGHLGAFKDPAGDARKNRA
jgi:hypothetical protein